MPDFAKLNIDDSADFLSKKKGTKNNKIQTVPTITYMYIHDMVKSKEREEREAILPPPWVSEDFL